MNDREAALFGLILGVLMGLYCLVSDNIGPENETAYEIAESR